MPNDEQNLGEEQVQPSPEATDEALTLEQLQGKKPEEVLELYNNAIEMRKSATQKFMESANERKKFEAEREYLLSERQRKDAELQRAYDQMAQFGKTFQQAGQQYQPSSPRNYEELTPEQAYAQLYKDNEQLKNQLAQMDGKWSKDKEELISEIHKTQSAIDYRNFLDKEILPKYKYVTERGLDDWFTEHPDMRFTGDLGRDRKLVHFAASEISKVKNDEFETEVQRRLAEKAKKAEQSQVVTGDTPLAALPDGKSMIDLTPAEQEEIVRRDIEQLQKK